MRPSVKNTIIISVAAVLIALGYFAFQPPSSQLDEREVIVSQSGTVTDGTGFPLNTEGNQFGTGAVTTPQKVFKKPSTDWKTRTLNMNGKWLTYEFGKGNPIGADPLSEKEKEIYKNCLFESELAQISCGRPGEEVNGYITPDIERDLLTLLSSPLWGPIFKNCEMQFRQNEYPEWRASYDQVVYSDYMNMENLLTIDPQTGRKSLSFGNFLPLQSWFNNSLRERQEVMGKDILKINNCITQNGGFELYRMMDVIYQKQFYPLWNYPARITDPKEYIPWN